MSKKLLAIVLSIVLCVSIFAIPMTVSAEQICCECYFSFAENGGYNYYWDTDVKNTFYIDFTGRSYDFDLEDTESNHQIQHMIGHSEQEEEKGAFGGLCFNTENIIIGDKVTYLGNNMLAYLYKVGNIYVPDSVTEIGTNVFPSQTDAIIHCSKDSVAIGGALESGLRFDTNGQTRKGDLNADGDINLLDLVAMRKALAKWHTGYEVTAIDANGDGVVNLLDLILIRKYLVRWSDAI
ncbi:MAG: dockerin type I domain-containing protein [Acutalibacteraceae bacterium]|nr:dockerin type I domain-containing protein [Acutalibacteraceae bacterium]